MDSIRDPCPGSKPRGPSSVPAERGAGEPKLLIFDPPRILQAIKTGDGVSCAADGAFQHQGEVTDITIGTLPGLLNFIGDVKAGKMIPVIIVGGQTIPVPLSLALDLDTAYAAGRLQVKDVPPAGDSASGSGPM